MRGDIRIDMTGVDHTLANAHFKLLRQAYGRRSQGYDHDDLLWDRLTTCYLWCCREYRPEKGSFAVFATRCLLACPVYRRERKFDGEAYAARAKRVVRPRDL